MMKQITAGAALSLMLAGAALAAGAWQGGREGMAPHRDRGAALARLQSQLAITSAQEPAWTRFTQALAAMHHRPAHRAESRSAGLTPAPKIFAAVAERMETRAKAARDLSAAAGALYQALSPTQRAVLDTHLADFMARRHHRWKRVHRNMSRPDARQPPGR